MSTPASSQLRVLVVDDEKNIRTTLGMCLESMGCSVVQAANAQEALQHATRHGFDLAFLDLKLGNDDGLELIPKLMAERPALHIVMVTAYATVDTAVEAIKRGAQDYLQKPFTPSQIRNIVDRARERMAVARRLGDLESRVESSSPEALLETASPAMRKVLDLLERAAASDVPVLLRGESGTGKSLLARILHSQSARRERPFVVVNCPTLSEDLLASELFGHARGAFTGAVKDQPGRMETADGGTVFLDEIGEIPPALQAKLLRFVQDKQFERVGEGKTRRADVRVMTATNRNLEEDVKSGRFREDLLYRINVVEVVVPALRERAEDILPLAASFLDFFSRTSARGRFSLSKEASTALQAYGWPGNIRELRNALERAVVLANDVVLQPSDFPPRISALTSVHPQVGGNFTVEQVTQEHIRAVEERTATQEEAARVLGVDVTTLWRRKKRR